MESPGSLSYLARLIRLVVCFFSKSAEINLVSFFWDSLGSLLFLRDTLAGFTTPSSFVLGKGAAHSGQHR